MSARASDPAAERLGILRAARDRPLHQSDAGRWVIDDQSRPDRRVRERLQAAGHLAFDLPATGGTGLVLTESGERLLADLERVLADAEAPER
jgi:hypothetical protein